jgi:hypothetical protein
MQITLYREAAGLDMADWLAPFINDIAIAERQIAIRIQPEKFGHSFESPREQQVVGIQESEHFSTGRGKTLVQSIRSTSIGFEDDLSQFRRVFLNHFPASVSGSRVNYDVFQIGVALLQNRVKRLGQEGSLIEGQCYDADSHGCLLGFNTFKMRGAAKL